MTLAVRLMLSAALVALAMGGGVCPKHGSGDEDGLRSGLLAYTARAETASGLYVANVEGSVLAQVGLGQVPPLRPTGGVTLSPERGRLAFSMVPVEGAVDDIFVVNRDGAALINLTNTADIAEEDPDWSRSGNVIAYSAGGDIWIVSTDGSGRRNITNTPDRDEGDPSWSPDGLEIAYTLDPNSDDSDVEAIGIDGTGRRAIAAYPDMDESAPSWSADGARIAFSARPIGGTSFREQADIYFVNADGTARRSVTRAGGDILCVGPAWSPDGELIAFRGTRVAETRSDIYIVRTTGTALRNFTNTAAVSEIAVDWR